MKVSRTRMKEIRYFEENEEGLPWPDQSEHGKLKHLPAAEIAEKQAAEKKCESAAEKRAMV